MTGSVLFCQDCGTANPATHNFCSHCGLALRTLSCPLCGARQPVGTIVCDSCGFSESESGEQPLFDQLDERKLVTAFFADIKGSVELLGERDIEEARHVIDSVILHISSLINRYEGTVIDTVGDGVFAVFGAPRSLDGHPRAAVNAALELQEQMRLNQNQEFLFNDIQLRIGIHTGDVIWRVLQVGRERRHLPVGQSVSQASRLQNVAEPGSVLIGESTYELVKDYFRFVPVTGLNLKGFPGPISAYKVIKPSEISRNLEASIKRGLSPLVGRDQELKCIADSFHSLATGLGHAVILVSEAGGGKSRLLHEAKNELSDHYCLIEAFCISHMQSSPWYPIIQLIRQLFDIVPGMPSQDVNALLNQKLLDLDPALAGDLLTLQQFLDLDSKVVVPANSDPASRKRKYISLFLRLLTLQAKKVPLIIVIEDLHWLDYQSVEVVDSMMSMVADHPILLLCTSRPEGVKASWRSLCNPVLQLGNLDLVDSRKLMKSLVPDSDLNEDAILAIQNKTQGNPFFIEEIIRSLRASGLPVLAGNETTIVANSMPSTIKMAIADRIDRLPVKAKKYLQMLAVVGIKCRVFLFAKLIAEPHESVVDILSELQELGFITRSKLDNQLYVQFGHVLTQEVAYSTLLSDSRALLHEYIADTMKGEFADMLQEILPELAYHYQNSASDAKAVEHLYLAGESAIQRSAHPEAQNYLRSALVRLDKSCQIPQSDSFLSRIWLSLGVSLQVTLGYAASEVKTAYEHAVHYSEKAGDSNYLLAALRGYGIFNIVKGNYVEAEVIAGRLKAHAKGEPAFALEHLILSGLSFSYRGQLEEGAKYYKKGLSIAVQPAASTTIQYSGYSPGICYSYYALNALFAGRLRLARDHAKKGLEVAHASGIPIAIAQSRGMYANVLFSFCEFSKAEQEHQLNVAFSDENGFSYWSLLGRLLIVWTAGYLRREESSLVDFKNYLEAYRGSGALIGVPWFLNLYAELLWLFGREGEALVCLDESGGIASLTQERFFLVDTLRLKGEVLAALSPDQASGEAMACFREAIQLSHSQGAWLPGLRAALRLARLLRRQGDLEEAKALLASHYSKLSWIKCPDHAEARTMIQELSAAV